MIIDDSVQRKALNAGFSLAAGTSLEGHITLEKGNRIYGGRFTNISLSAYSYVVSATATNVSVGRYCSIAHGVELGFYNHPTDWVSSHPFPFLPYMPEPIQWPTPF